MTDNTIDRKERRHLVSGLGMAAIAGAAIGAAPAQAQSSGFQPKRHEQDAWMDKIPGVHRVFIDTSDASGGSNALLYAGNILGEHANAYDGSDDEMAMIVCYRHASTPFAFNDAMWEKYGAGFALLTGQDGDVPVTNTLTGQIEAMAARGVQYAICNKASQLTASMAARQAGLDADEVYQELISNAIPNAHFVPAGVVAMTRAQEYGYSLLYAA